MAAAYESPIELPKTPLELRERMLVAYNQGLLCGMKLTVNVIATASALHDKDEAVCEFCDCLLDTLTEAFRAAQVSVDLERLMGKEPEGGIQ